MRPRKQILLPVTALMVRFSLQTGLDMDFCSMSYLLSPFVQYSCPASDALSPSSHTEDGYHPHAASSSQMDDTQDQDAWERIHDCISPYCIYSNRGFCGQGMAVVTTERNYQLVKQLSSIPASREVDNAKYEVAKIQGKGNGLIASRAIHRGESIMATKPALLVHQSLFGDLDLEDLYEMVDAAVDSLPDARKSRYMAQAGEMGGHKNIDIMFTNSYQISLGDQDSFHYGNFPDASLFNHDCRPNLAFYIDANLTHRTHAIRDIQPGEELTVSYLDPFQIRSARQERTRNTMGFSCSCSQCSLPKKEADASDVRLLTIQQLENELSDFNSQVSSPALVERLMALYKEERLGFKIAGAYTIAALNYSLFGNAKMAKKYAELAVNAGLLEQGPDNADVRSMQELGNDPKRHWSFNLKPYKGKY